MTSDGSGMPSVQVNPAHDFLRTTVATDRAWSGLIAFVARDHPVPHLGAQGHPVLNGEWRNATQSTVLRLAVRSGR